MSTKKKYYVATYDGNIESVEIFTEQQKGEYRLAVESAETGREVGDYETYSFGEVS